MDLSNLTTEELKIYYNEYMRRRYNKNKDKISIRRKNKRLSNRQQIINKKVSNRQQNNKIISSNRTKDKSKKESNRQQENKNTSSISKFENIFS